jgi:predicted O-linked N-acetylglucosamine transferase (SPINDLY family)
MSAAFAEVVLRHKAGQIDAAAAGYQAILAEDPRHEGALCNLAVLEAGRGDLARAVALFKAAVALHPNDHEIWVNYANLLVRHGDLPGAEQAYRQAAAVQPKHAAAWLGLGRLLAAAGDNAGAADALGRAARLLPHLGEVQRELGVALGEIGRNDEALAALGTAIERDPLDGEAVFHRGRLLHQRGDLAEAADAYRLARDIVGDVPELLCNLGNVLNDLGRHAEALPLLEAAVDVRPDFAMAANNLGIALDALGQLEPAIAAFARAVAADPQLAGAAFNLGRALARGQRTEEAISWLKRAAALDPESAPPRVALASALTGANVLDEAAVQWQRAIDLAPDVSNYHAALGYVMVKLRRPAKALAAAERAIAGNPGAVDAYLVKSQAQRLTGDEAGAAETRRHAECMVESIPRDREQPIVDLLCLAGQHYHAGDFRNAARLYRRLLAIDPARDDARARLIDSTLSLCDWADYDGFTSGLLDAVRKDIAEARLRLDVFNLLALPIDNALLFDAARAKAQTLVREAGVTSPLVAPAAAAARPQRLKVGFALPYTYFHSMPFVLNGIIRRLDRARFEPIGYSVQPCDGSSFSRDFRPAFDSFRDLPLGAPAQAAAIIAADKLDLLIDTTGHTSVNCLDILAHRPAPVQAHYLGYGLTSGAEFVDYLITDRHFMPPEWARFCSERLVYLPDSFMATAKPPPAPGNVTRASEGLPEQALVLANFNHPCKLEPRMFGVWIRLLRAVPDAVLWLGGWAIATQDSLKRFAAEQGVDPARLIFAKILPQALHLSRLKLADLALDNLRHGGGVTSVDALWSGLPLLTVKGKTPAGRLGATLSHAVGLDDLVTETLEHYESMLMALAADRPRLAALKAQLAANLPRCALFDEQRYQRHIEAAFDLMWAHRGEPCSALPLVVTPLS